MAGYDVITFDTQTVISNGYAFHSGLLESLKSLREHPIKVVVTDVVKNEIKKHTSRFYQDLIQKNNDSNRKNHEHGLLDAIPKKTFLPKQAGEIAETKLNEYLRSLNCSILEIDSVSLVEVMERFYRSDPPFSKGGDKKNEFPDAISLLTLNHYATKNNYRILAISGDKDWVRFAADNEHFDLVKDVSEALNLINKHREEAYNVVEKVLQSLIAGEPEETYQQIDALLSDQISMEFPLIEASSSFYFDYNDVYLEFSHFYLVDDQFKMLEISNDLTSFKIEVEAIINYTASATFSFSAVDHIDDDYFVITDDAHSVDREAETKLLISFSIVDGEIDILDINITKFPRSINFGDIEPDFS